MQKRLVFIGALGLAFLAGMFFGPTEVKEVEKIVYKERSNTKVNSKRKTEKKETINPDGSKTIETVTTVDRTSDKKTETDMARESKKESKSTGRPDWHLSVSYFPSAPNQEKEWGVTLEKRLFSEIYLGVTGNTKQQYGLSIGIGF